MACFLVPATEAVVVAVVKKVKEKSEENAGEDKVIEAGTPRIPFSRKLSWLVWMLVGGAFLLAFEHVWHGEVVPWFPFLSAMSDPGDAAEMFHEMATVGVTMAALITVVWIGMCIAASIIVKRGEKKPESQHTA